MRALLFTAAIFVVSTINIQCTDTAEYYVSPPNGALCPDNTVCHNLSLYVLDYRSYFINNTVFYFLEGTHVLEQQLLLLTGLQNVTFQGIGNIEQGFDETVSQSTVILTCNERIGGVVFLSCENINIKGITINNCSTYYEFYTVHLNASLAIYNSININLENLSIQNSSHNGLVMSNVLNMTVLKCSFARNALQNGGNVLAVFLGLEIPLTKIWNILLEDSNITSSSFDGLVVEFLQEQYTVNFNLQSVQVVNNRFRNMVFAALSSCQYSLQLNEVVCIGSYNISFELFQKNCPSYGKPVIHITDSIFAYNHAIAFGLYWLTTKPGIVTIESTRFVENIGSVESAMHIEQLKRPIIANGTILEVKLSNVTFKGNMFNETLSKQLGLTSEARFTIDIISINDIVLTDCVFEDNNGTGLLIYDSCVTFAGRNVFINNTGFRGGAILMLNNAFMLLDCEAQLSFINNHAIKSGGAIHVVQNLLRVYDGDNLNNKYVAKCFYQLSECNTESPSSIKKYFIFQNNSANIAGSAVYGGITSGCISWTTMTRVGRDFFVNISTFVNHTGQSVISSNARAVCFCNGNVLNCSEVKNNFQVSPGGSFTFTVMAIGNRNGATPGIVQVRDDNAIRPVTNFNISAKCTPITHSVQVTNSSLSTIDIYVTLGDFESNTEPNILPVRVDIEPCPAGFYLSSVTRVCECTKEISSVANCDPSTGTIERSGSLWISYDNEYNCTIIDRDCPFDYCKFSTVNFTLNEPNDQCSFNRIGQLCGGCEEHFSVVLGSNKCKECSSNVYILLIIPFALAGIILVVFLLILNLTVSVGTINGLIFYANIVKLYEPLFPTEPIPFLGQFISWINLDLGIETCFYKGMNACEKTGLQFIFPFYLWFIIGLIILLARYFSKISKLIGNNATPVLATVLLLSYTKLLRTAILILSISQISCDGNSQSYWYVDADIPYFRSCHLPLFITAVIVLILLVIPYTLFLLLFPLVERFNTNCKLPFLIKFKPFFDAYGGPHNDKFRFWPGILLLVRVILALSVGLSDKIDFQLGVLVAFIVILILSLSFGKIYKTFHYILDIWFMLCLIIIVHIIQGSINGNFSSKQAEYGLIVIFTLSFITFCGIIFYHVCIHSILGNCFRQTWQSSYRMKSIPSPIVNNAKVTHSDIYRGEVDEIPPTDYNVEYREPLLESAFHE